MTRLGWILLIGFFGNIGAAWWIHTQDAALRLLVLSLLGTFISGVGLVAELRAAKEEEDDGQEPEDVPVPSSSPSDGG